MSVFLKKGEFFSGCEILARCGQGSCGITYLARNPIGRKIVIKVTAAPRYTDRELKGLRNYMQVSGSHPNLLQIFHIGDFPEGLYYTMEAADNCSLTGNYLPATLGNMLRQGKRFSPEEAVTILRGLLAGIDAMHRSGLIHRDIKPDNIIFVNGTPKLSDPGLVISEGEHATFAGTPGFIPPEMLAHETPADRQSDLYALGKVFYCMVTGNPPKLYPEFPDTMGISLQRQLFPVLFQACHRRAERRFQSAGEFLDALPLTLAPPTPLEKWCTDFRNWKKINRKTLQLILWGITLILLAAAGTALWMTVQKFKETQRINNMQQHVKAFLSLNRDRRELIPLQLKLADPELQRQYNKAERSLLLARQKKEWPQAFSAMKKLRSFLQKNAFNFMPQIPDDPGDFSKDMAAAGKAHGFLAAPLAEYLPEKTLKEYRKRLAAFERKVYTGWNGLRCGVGLNSFNHYYAPLVFVPPGIVRMRHNNKLYKIPYHFWISSIEVPHEHFTRIMGIAPQRSPHANTPVERVAWNDILFYCYLVTKHMKEAGLLPPGYIIRPPTETEWEYAANNAWLGKETRPLEELAVLKQNSGGRSWPAGSKPAGKLGLFDMHGNLSEVVQKVQETAMQNAIVIRGGSFLQRSPHRRSETLVYQSIPYDIGFRIAAAPGDMTYFDRHFFICGPMQARTAGKVYELIGGNTGAFTRHKAHTLARLLGGRLGEFEGRELLDSVSRQIPLAASEWGCFTGGIRKGNKWIWEHSGREIDFGNWYKRSRIRENPSYLLLQNKRWKAVGNIVRPIFLCEWDAADFPGRNEHLTADPSPPGVLARFSAGGRRFMLIDSSMLWNGAERFCQLLGGHLASLDTPEIRREAVKNLEKFRQYKIMLGGYAKREKWYWLSGKEIKSALKQEPFTYIPSRNRNYVILKEGELCSSQSGQLFLCEWRNEKDSSPN